MKTYSIAGNSFQISNTSLGQYLEIVRLMESMQIKQPFDVKSSGESLVYVGRFLDELVTKRALAKFFSIILEPAEPMPIWILGGIIKPIRTWILLKITDHQAVAILQDFFLAKKELWDEAVTWFQNSRSEKRKSD